MTQSGSALKFSPVVTQKFGINFLQSSRASVIEPYPTYELYTILQLLCPRRKPTKSKLRRISERVSILKFNQLAFSGQLLHDVDFFIMLSAQMSLPYADQGSSQGGRGVDRADRVVGAMDRLTQRGVETRTNFID